MPVLFYFIILLRDILLPIFHIIDYTALVDSLNKHLEMQFVSMGMYIFTFESYFPIVLYPLYTHQLCTSGYFLKSLLNQYFNKCFDLWQFDWEKLCICL